MWKYLESCPCRKERAGTVAAAAAATATATQNAVRQRAARRWRLAGGSGGGVAHRDKTRRAPSERSERTHARAELYLVSKISLIIWQNVRCRRRRSRSREINAVHIQHEPRRIRKQGAHEDFCTRERSLWRQPGD